MTTETAIADAGNACNATAEESRLTVDASASAEENGPHIETASELTLANLLDDVAQLDGCDIEGVKVLLANASETRLPPGDLAVLQQRISKATKLSIAVLGKMAVDVENAHNGRVLHSPRSIAEAVIEEVQETYGKFLYYEGRFYGYCDPRGDATIGNSGYFARFTRAEIEEWISQEWWGKPAIVDKGKRRAAIDLVATRLSDPRFFASAATGVNLRNGFLKYDPSTNTVRLLRHSPSHRARWKLDVEWTKGASPATLQAGLDRVLPDRVAQRAMQEFMGCTVLGLSPGRDAARNILLMIGDRLSTKSTMLEVMRMLLPEDAVAAVPPSRWNEDYQRAKLNGVRANLVTELDPTAKVNSAQLKAIASCEPVTARLPFQDPIEFVPVAKHLFAANGVFRVNHAHDAVERRCVAIRFGDGLRPEEVDPGFMDKLRAELPAILSWLVEGALRVMERGHYELPVGHRAIVHQMQHGDETLVRFVVERIEPAAAGERPLTARELSAAYREFLESEGVSTEGFTEVTDARRRAAVLKALFDFEQGKTQGHPVYRGIRLKKRA